MHLLFVTDISSGVTHAQNRRFSPKIISDRRGETGCCETWGHITFAKKLPFPLVIPHLQDDYLKKYDNIGF